MESCLYSILFQYPFSLNLHILSRNSNDKWQIVHEIVSKFVTENRSRYCFSYGEQDLALLMSVIGVHSPSAISKIPVSWTKVRVYKYNHDAQKLPGGVKVPMQRKKDFKMLKIKSERCVCNSEVCLICTYEVPLHNDLLKKHNYLQEYLSKLLETVHLH